MCKPNRKIAAVLAVTLLLAGCGQAAPVAPAPVSSASPTAVPTSTPPPAATLADDKLRILGNTVFCGTAPIFTATHSGQVRLLTDTATGEADYFMDWAPSGSDAQQYLLRDKAGLVVYDCQNNSIDWPCNGWIVVSAGDYGQARPALLVHLKSGRQITLPKDLRSIQLYALDQETCLVLCVMPATRHVTAVCSWDMEAKSILKEHSVHIYHGSYNGWAVSCPTNKTEGLYNFHTGESLPNAFYPYLSQNGFGYLNGENNTRQVVDLNTGAVVYTGTDNIAQYFGGDVLYTTYADAGKCQAHWADGTLWGDILIEPNYTDHPTAGDDRLALCGNGQMALCTANGSLLWQIPLAVLPAELENRKILYEELYTLADDRVLLAHGLSNGQVLYRIYGVDGLLWQSMDYNYVNIPAGGHYLLLGRTRGGDLTDARATDGTILVSGVAKTRFYRAEPWFFYGRRGFDEGWMDLAGNWLYKQSIWQSPIDEHTDTWYYDE